MDGDVGEVQVGVVASRAAARRRLGRHLLVTPDLAWTLVFFLIPFGLIVVYSFGTFDVVLYRVTFGWTLANYADLTDALYMGAFVRSLVLSAATVGGCLLVGYPLAYFISAQRAGWQRVLLALVVVPFWSSFIVRTYAMTNILENDGPLDDLARLAGLTSGHLNVLYSNKAIAIGLVYSYLPTMVLPIYVALERLERTVVEAAGDLGANGFRTFWRVVFPLSLPGVIAGCLITGIPAVGEFVVPDILGGGKTLMIGNIVTDQYLSVGNIPFGSAIAVALMLVLGIVLAAAARRIRTVGVL